MAAATSDRVLQNGRYAKPEGVKSEVTANAKIYGGTLVGIRTSDGKAEPATGAGSYNAIVFAPEQIDSGEDGTVLSDVVILFDTSAAFTEADRFNPAYVSDDSTVMDAQTSAAEPTVGEILDIQDSGNEAFVHVKGFYA